jgi:hypothetical protein
MLQKKILYTDNKKSTINILAPEVISKLGEERLSINGYLILSTLMTKQYDKYDAYVDIFPIGGEVFQNLYREGFITCEAIDMATIYSVELTEKALDLFKEDSTDVETWAEEWRNLWPKGVTSGGYPVRADLPSIKKKMKAFTKKYSYDKETIFQTTKQYLEDKRLQNYSYIKTAA